MRRRYASHLEAMIQQNLASSANNATNIILRMTWNSYPNVQTTFFCWQITRKTFAIMKFFRHDCTAMMSRQNLPFFFSDSSSSMAILWHFHGKASEREHPDFDQAVQLSPQDLHLHQGSLWPEGEENSSNTHGTDILD